MAPATLALAQCCTEQFPGGEIEDCDACHAAPADALRGRYDLCVAALDGHNVTGRHDRLLLSVIRNLHCARIELLLLPPGESARMTSAERVLFGLGFKKVLLLQDAGREAWWYRYELQHYNRKRGWNSPENWANPQNFDRFRW